MRINVTNLVAFSWFTCLIGCQSSETDPCSLSPDPGHCGSQFLRYFYDRQHGRCRQFIYTGCHGNQNNFAAEEDCLSRCDQSTLSPGNSQPNERLSNFLVLSSKSNKIAFTFTRPSSYIAISHNELQFFPLRETQEISFEFRTTRGEGLLFYHNLRRGRTEYELHVLLEAGRLKSVLVVDFTETSNLIGAGLGDDQWHEVQLRVDTELRQVQITLDKAAAEPSVTLIWENDRDIHDDDDSETNSSVIFIGGVNKTSDDWLYTKDQFYGCIRHVQTQTGRWQSDSVKPLLASQHQHVEEGCIDRCATSENKCRNGAKCLNHYHRTTCDCYGTSHEGNTCDYDDPAVVTLDGFSHLSYRLGDWAERSSAEINRLSLLFRTHAGGSSLLYGRGSSDHIDVSLLKNGSLHLDLRVKEVSQFAVVGEQLNNGLWHNFTLVYNGSRPLVFVDGRQTNSLFDGENYPQMDPFIYIGGGPATSNPGSLLPSNNFVGCLKEVYINDVSVLYKLRVNSDEAIFHGDNPPKFGDCRALPEMPITFPLRESQLVLDVPEQLPLFRYPLELSFSFRTNDISAVLVSGKVRFTDDSAGLWELRLTRSSLEMRVYADLINATYVSVLNEGSALHDGSWHRILFKHNAEEVVLAVDQRVSPSVILRRILPKPFQVADRIVFGANLLDRNSSFLGCMKDIIINRVRQDPREISRKGWNAKAVLFGSCYATEDPCGEANLCLHNGTCLLTSENGVTCDCSGTGYVGSRCQFAVNGRSCEEVALLGNKDGVYLLDIDGNGPYPPARVRCQMDTDTGAWKTLVHHNFPPETVIRSSDHENLIYSLTYDGFTSDMLRSLISQSAQCRQFIKYDCHLAPLDLHSYTWFQSSSGVYLDSIGEAPPGKCPCATNSSSCIESSVYCNCDAAQDRWNSDQGLLTQPDHLAITRVFALQQKNLETKSEGKLIIGPLECVQPSTQMYVTTFQTADSFLEVPGWYRGALSFSFRTFQWPALLVHHRHRGQRQDFLRVVLENEYETSLTFWVNGDKRVYAIKSSRPLSSGEWQHVSIDSSAQEIRFTVNQQYLLIRVDQESQFGPFGPFLYVGGAPGENVDEDSPASQLGLVGCLRGLVINDRLVNTHALIPRRFSSAVHKDCQLSCDPNPCLNGATCVESWGSYKCLCANPHAHIGRYCQQDINLNGVTFHNHEIFLEDGGYSLSQGDFQGIFTDDLTLNLRTADTNSLVLYAYDHLNNFVGIYLEDGRLVFQFNSAGAVHTLSTNVSGTADHIQIFIDREPHATSLVVNGIVTAAETPLKLLDRYHRRPWINRNKELVKPPRPVQRPEDFYQVFIGGVDREYIRTLLRGFTGCLRGFQIGDRLIDLPAWSKRDSLKDDADITEGCNYLCDAKPCQNGGSCVDNLSEKTYICDCQFTSYNGQNCTEEIASTFQGNWYQSAALAEGGGFYEIHVHLAWSSTHSATESQILVLVSSSAQHYFFAVLHPTGSLQVEETRGTPDVFYGREIAESNFLDGARHSLHYRRNGNTSILLVDGTEFALDAQSSSLLGDSSNEIPANRIHLGGSDLTAFSPYQGCLANVRVRVDGVDYEDFSSSSESPHADDREETPVRCAAFLHNLVEPSESRNDPGSNSFAETWTSSPVSVTKYVPVFETTTPQFDSTNLNRILLALGCAFFVCILILAAYLRKLHRFNKKRQQVRDGQLRDMPRGPSPPPVLRESSALVRSVGVTASPVSAKGNCERVTQSMDRNNSGLGSTATPARTLIEDLIRYMDCDEPRYQQLDNCHTPDDERAPTVYESSTYRRSPTPPNEDPVDDDILPEEPVFLYSVNRAPLCRISEIYLTEDDEERRLPVSDGKFLTYTADYTF